MVLLTVNACYFTLPRGHIRGRKEMSFQRRRRWSAGGLINAARIPDRAGAAILACGLPQ
jgi:hypothetical protein